MTRLWGAVLGVAVVAAACGENVPATVAECGNGVVEGSETCDDGDRNGQGGCAVDCTFTCVDPALDCGTPPACQVAACTSDHTCSFVGDTSLDGTSCGTSRICMNGACVMMAPSTCGNGVQEGSEACDFGIENGPNAGCEEDCTLSCADATSCADGDACNGEETCESVTIGTQTGKRCVAGTALLNGTSCGTGMLCINEVCTAASCGDGYTTAPEECDDANAMAGDGCEPTTCTFTCVSTDQARNCTPADPCAGQGTCNDATHTCTPGTPLDDNTACGTGGYCKAGACTQPVCPNGTQEPGETCDDGNQTDGDGCDNDCTYSCVTPATDCGTPPVCSAYACTGSHTCTIVADTSQNGETCGTNGETCQNGACTGGVCGNGVTEIGEQCDFGADNGPGTGCESNCQFSCTMSPDSCDDGNACNGTEACVAVTVKSRSGQKCSAGTPLSDNTSCGTGKICKAQLCVSSVCGDGYVDSARGEMCEPPNTATCDSGCRAKVCGDGVRADNEQCDDGNTTNLDGCSASCRFEQCHRIIDLDLQFGTSTYCPKNALGRAAGSLAQSLITDAIDQGVADGSITIIFQMLGLDDLTGTNDPSLSLGVITGPPVAGSGYNGNSDLDWWYTIESTDLTNDRTPIQTVPASIAAKQLDAGPADMTFNVNFVGVDVTMDMFSTTLRALIGAATNPLISTNGTTPGHLPAENLDPALVSFATMGAPTQADLCGATTARSLEETNMPTTVVSYCPQYTISHSLLDLYISGCTYAFIFPIVKATQPDTSRNGTDTYRFQADSNRNVISCTKNNQPANMDECLDNAGYTSYYKFTTDRVIGK
jgi:cysteine-rich repeat protein